MVIVHALQRLSRTEPETPDVRYAVLVRSAVTVLIGIYRSTNQTNIRFGNRSVLSMAIATVFATMIDNFIGVELGLKYSNGVSENWRKERKALAREYSGKDSERILREADTFCHSLENSRSRSKGAADLYGELKSLCIALVVQFSNEDQPSAEYEETLFALNQIIARLNAAIG